MTTTPVPTNVPASLLVATDLSPRCDRALDRAIQLAQTWAASLTALYVFDAPTEPDRILAWAAGDPAFDLQIEASRQLRRDLAGLGERADVRLMRSKSPAEVIDRVAGEVAAGLVVTGVARDEPLGRFALGSTVEVLARTLRRPVLIVRNRVRSPYLRVAAATDLSERAKAAVVTAVRWFPDAETHLFHAASRPVSLSKRGRDAEAEASGALIGRCERFVAQSGLPRTAIHRVAAVADDLAPGLTRYVRQNEVDLAVIGAHEGQGLLELFLGNSLEKLLQWLPCDVLVVPMDA